MSFRLVQRPANPKGLAIGFLIGSMIDKQLRDALPDWAIVATDQAPLTPTSSDLIAARALAKVDADAPIGLFGFSAGCQPVRTLLLANLVKGPLAFVAVFDGTHGSVPPQAWQIDTWKKARERAGKFLATCTSMTYTKRIPEGQPGRATPTREILEAVIGTTLEVGTPFVEGNTYVERFASGDIDAAAHGHQETVVLPALLKKWIGGVVESSPASPATEDEEGPVTARPVTFRDRVLAWCKAELAAGVKEIPDGSNDSPRIREYFDTSDFERDGKQIKIHSVPWCAAAACMAHHESFQDGDNQPPQARVSGIELERDARANGKFYTGEGAPGDMAIFTRPGASWERHVTHVLSWDGATFTTIAGNEANTWKITEHASDAADLIGFVQTQ